MKRIDKKGKVAQFFCRHEYVTIEETTKTDNQTKEIIIEQCKKCGKIKKQIQMINVS